MKEIVNNFFDESVTFIKQIKKNTKPMQQQEHPA